MRLVARVRHFELDSMTLHPCVQAPVMGLAERHQIAVQLLAAKAVVAGVVEVDLLVAAADPADLGVAREVGLSDCQQNRAAAVGGVALVAQLLDPLLGGRSHLQKDPGDCSGASARRGCRTLPGVD
jgi:hypothetical protein